MTEESLPFSKELTHILSMSPNLGKREIIRRSTELIEAQNGRINNQVKAINRLLDRWNDLHEFIVGMDQEFYKPPVDDLNMALGAVTKAIIAEMVRLETNDPDPEPVSDVIVPG